jgi:EmrB/QacA subfamily drug resistance transporter
MIARAPCDVEVIKSRKFARREPDGAGGWVLAATVLGSSMVFIDGSAVNVVLPVLQSDLHATAIELQWVVVGYTLFLSSLMLAGGALGDRIGRRRVFIAGAASFAIASALCGLAHDARTLIVARALQGVGSAMLTPGSLAIIGASFADGARARAIATWSSVTAITAALGPALGGWLAQHASWRWVFYINLPIAAAVIAISLLRVRESSDGKSASSIDWLGAVLGTIGLGGIVYGLTFVSALGIDAPSVLLGLVAGGLALAAFAYVEALAADPLLPLDLFRRKTFAGANLLTLLLYGGLSGVMYFVPFRMIQIDGYSPTDAGLTLLPFVALIFALSPLAGELVRSVGARLPLVAGSIVAACGCALLGAAGSGHTYWTSYFPGIAALGLGMALCVAPLTAAVMQSVPVGEVGVASGVNNAVSRIASLLAIAALGSLMIAAFSHALAVRLDAAGIAGSVRDAVIEGRFALAQTPIPALADAAARARIHDAIVGAYASSFSLVMFACAALAAGGAIIAAFTIDREPARSR